MRELRRRRARAGLAVLLLAAPAGAALASTGTGELLVRGPLDLIGAASLEAQGAALLLRDPAAPQPGAVHLALEAGLAQVTYHRVEEICLDAARAGARVATVALPPVADRPSPLETVEVVLARLLAQAPRHDSAGPAATPASHAESSRDAAAGGGTRAPEAARAMADAPLAPDAALPARPAPEGGLACFAWRPGSSRERFELFNLALEVRPLDAGYAVFWDGTLDPDTWPEEGGPDSPEAQPAPGAATLNADRVASQLLTRPEVVALAEEPDAEFGAYVPHVRLARGLVRNEAGGGRGVILGNGEALLYGVEAVLRGARGDGSTFERAYETGERREPAALAGQERRVLSFLRVELLGAAGTYESPAAVQVYGRSVAARLDGELAIPDARGTLAVGNRTLALAGGPARLAGLLEFTLEAARREEPWGYERYDWERVGDELPRDAMRLSMGGDVQRVESAGVREEFPAELAGAAAAASAVAVAAGLLAYFWPALKFAATPLYTRVPPDGVLGHEARQRIYRLIQDEAGIHAHEVATRLGLGWGTAVYHLKLLERSGYVVARREGRYKRFFVTGDPRVQHQAAVAMLRNATARRIAGLVAARPGLIQKQLCGALGLSPSLASWHLQRLEAAGVVLAERAGRAVRYAPGPCWAALAPAGNGGPAAAEPAARPASAP